MSPETLSSTGQNNFNLQLEGFDMNAAFRGAIADVATDEELALTQKVSRMESILETGQSEVYRDFVDFRAMAAQVEMFCNHDHEFGQAMEASKTVNGFMDDHHEGHDSHGGHGYQVADEKDKKKKKKKLRRGWFSITKS